MRPLKRCGMRRAFIRVAFAIVASLLPARGALQAQTLNCDCAVDSVAVLMNEAIGSGWMDLHPRSLSMDLTELRALGRWSEAVGVIARRFDRRAAIVPGNERTAMLRMLDSARTIVADLESLPGGRLGTDRAPQAWFAVSLTPDQEGLQTLAGLPVGPLVMADSTPSSVRRAVCWTALAMEQLLNSMNTSGRAKALLMARERYDRWENFARYGYTQFPHELAINGLREERKRRKDRTLEPPSSQWIVLHPSAGAELAVADRDGNFKQPEDWVESQAIVLEVAGLLLYGPLRRNYFGVSGVVTFPGGQGIGLGGLLHINRDLKAGVVYHGDAPRRLGLLASVDLRRWLADTPQGVKEMLERAKQEVFVNYSEEGAH